MSKSRRKFIKDTGIAAIASTLISNEFHILKRLRSEEPLEVHLFSKHLQFLNIKEAAQIANELGFAGLDLTVRPKGHVLPENVRTHLPRAIKEIRASGIVCQMITTAVEDATKQLDIDVLEVAGREGVQYYRSNWFKYLDGLSLDESLDHFQEKVRELGKLNKVNDIIGCYQNHSGTKIGASIWEVRKILDSVDPAFFGAQYDIRHAVAEGGRSWSNGVKLIHDRIMTIVLKDFIWGKVDGKWKIVNVPMGEGMVDFKAYFKLLKSYGLRPPVSLHLEYPLGGAEKGRPEITIDPQEVYDAMSNDLAMIHKLWKES